MIFCTSQKCGPVEIAGPGTAAPLAPPLMRPWSPGSSLHTLQYSYNGV